MGLVLEHIIKKPTEIGAQKPPLLLLLHGYGSDENDLFPFSEELPQNYFVISAKAPKPLQPYGNAWYDIFMDHNGVKASDEQGAIEARDLIAQFIDQATAHYELDPFNVTLLGFSQGAILSYAVALTYPEKIKNVIGLSGYIIEATIAIKSAPSYKHLNVYCSHGSVDQVIPIAAARAIPEFLANCGIDTQLSEFPVGHGVHPNNFYEFKNWLQKVNT